MFRKLLPLVLIFSSLSYAGQLKSVDFLYSSEPAVGVSRNFLEIDLIQEGCSVIPEKERGKEIVVDLKNCEINRPYFVGKRGDFVKGAKLIPKGKGSLLIVELNKTGILKLSKSGRTVKLKILEGDFIKPEINSLRTVSGEEIVIDFPVPVTPKFEKIGNRLILNVPNVKLEPSEGRINATCVNSVSFSNSEKGGVITLTLSPKVKAVEVLSKGKRVFLKLLAPEMKLAKSRGKNFKLKEPKVILHFANADVRSVVEAIASVAKANVVFGPKVKGKITVNFRKPIYWKDALKAVLTPLMLSYKETPDYIYVYSLKNLRKEPIKLYVIKLRYISVYDFLRRILGNGCVDCNSVENSEYFNQVRKVLELGKGEDIALIGYSNSIVLKVTPSHYKEILNLIKSIDKPQKQILIKAKIVEISSNASEETGIDWFFGGYKINKSITYPYTPFEPSSGATGLSSGGLDKIFGTDTNTSNYWPVMDMTKYVSSYSSILDLAILRKNFAYRMQLAIRALELEGKAKTISSPRVLVQDNKVAIIEQGIEIPYKEASVSSGGVTNYQIKFRKAALILKVRPHIENNGKINLDLLVSKDSPNYEYISITGNNEPAINSKKVRTVVSVREGDTIVIGGIYERERKSSRSGIPVLSKIPLLGWLFKNTSNVESDNKLLIFITPEVINKE